VSAPASPGAPLLGRALLVAWIVWLLGAVNYGHAFFQRTNPSAMTDDLMREFGVSAAALGNLAAVYMYAYAALQIPAGVAFDRWGPRAILAGAAACCAAGAVLFGLAPSIEVAMLGRLLIGVGAGFSFLGALTLTMIWFPRERYDVMIGFIPPVGIAGAVLGQAPFGALVEAVGWRPAILATAGLAALLACLFWVSRRVPAPLTHAPDGHAEPVRPHLLAGLRRAVRDPQTWLLGVSGGFIAGPFLAFGALWAVPWLMQVRGLERLSATSSASVILLGLAIGSPFAGWLSNRLRRRKAVLVSFNGLSLVVWLPLIYWPNLPDAALYLLFALVGMANAGVLLNFVMARDHSSTGRSGSASAIVNTFVVGCGALLLPLIGVLLDANWDGTLIEGVRVFSAPAYETAFILLPLSSGLALLASIILRESHPARARGARPDGAVP
jgi:predicted MFS family arabinose efflux permease